MKKIACIVGLLMLFCIPLFAQATGNEEPVQWALPAVILSIVGVFAPFAINLITKAIQESWARYLIALFLSGLIGFIGLIILGIPLTLANIAVTLPAFFMLATTAWKLWWHKLLK